MSSRIRRFIRRIPPFVRETDMQFMFRMDHMELGSKHPTQRDMVCVEHSMKPHSKTHYLLTAVFRLIPGMRFIEGHSIVPKGTSHVNWRARLVKKAVQ